MTAAFHAASDGDEAALDWATLSPALDRWLDADDARRDGLLTDWRRDAPALARAVEEAAARMVVTDRQAFMARSAQTPQSTESTDATTSSAVPGDRPAEPVAGDRCGAYRLLERIGSGGMGSVWLAKRDDGLYEGRVAVKLLHAGLSSHAQSGRFLLEGRFLARLDDPHIARLLDAGVGEGGLPYWVIEHVDGLPLDRYCDEHALDLSARIALCADVLDAVAHAHGRLILHRDLKPSNILVDRAGQVKLLDFGVAKLLDETFAPSDDLTRDHGAAYTPHYAAPEQIADEALTTATDTYAIGLLLFALVTGQDAFPTARVGLLQRLKTLRAGPPRASQVLAASGGADAARRARAVHGDLDTVIGKALRFEPEQRYQSAAGFAQELRRFLAFEPILARPDGPTYRMRLFVRRHRWESAAAASATLALMVAVGVASTQAREADRRRDQSEALVSFMINDLSDSLGAAGRLELLASASQKVLEHYASEDPRRADRESLANRATVLAELGGLAMERGRLDMAHAALAQSGEVAAALVARWPDSAEAAAASAREKSNEGYLASISSERPEDVAHAQAAMRAAVELSEVAYERDGHSDAMAALSGELLDNLGVVLVNTNRPEEGLAWLARAEPRLRQAARKHPQAGRDLVNGIASQADALYRLGRYEACVTVATPLLAVSDRMTDGSVDLSMRQLRDGGLNRLVSCDLNTDRVGEAVAVAREVVSSTNTLVALDPSHAELKERGRAYRLTLVEALSLAGDRPAAAALYAEIHAELAPLLTTVEGQDSAKMNNWLYFMTVAAARVGVPWESFRNLWSICLAARERSIGSGSEAGRFGTGSPIQAGTRMLEQLRGRGPAFVSEAGVLEAQVASLASVTPSPTDTRALIARAEFAFVQGRRADAATAVAGLLAMNVRHPDLLALQHRLDASR